MLIDIAEARACAAYLGLQPTMIDTMVEKARSGNIQAAVEIEVIIKHAYELGYTKSNTSKDAPTGTSGPRTHH